MQSLAQNLNSTLYSTLRQTRDMNDFWISLGSVVSGFFNTEKFCVLYWSRSEFAEVFARYDRKVLLPKLADPLIKSENLVLCPAEFKKVALADPAAVKNVFSTWLLNEPLTLYSIPVYRDNEHVASILTGFSDNEYDQDSLSLFSNIISEHLSYNYERFSLIVEIDELQLREAALGRMLEASPAAVVTRNRFNRVQFINQNMCDPASLPENPKLYLGASFQVIEEALKQKIEILDDHFSLNDSSSELLYLDDGRIIQKDIVTIKSGDNHVVEDFFQLMDVTNREQLNQKLTRLNEQLESANRMKSEFLANVSHELRTPLNSILGFSEILIRNRENNLTEKNLSQLQKIYTNAENLVRIINGLLDISKVEAGKITVEIARFDIISLCRDVVETMLPVAESKNARLEFRNPADETIYIRSDEGLVKQVLINLISNAIKFVGPSDGEVIVSLLKKGGWVGCKVVDNGIGIKKEELEKIFLPFQQADGGSTRKFGGTGLGLAIAKKLAEALNGVISAKSTPEKGSSFVFAIPA